MYSHNVNFSKFVLLYRISAKIKNIVKF